MKRSILTGILLTIVLALNLTALLAHAQSFSGGPSEIASLRYSITVDEDTLRPNQTVTYTIQVQNTSGPVDSLKNVEARFAIPQLEGTKLLLDTLTFRLIQGQLPRPGFNAFNEGKIVWDWRAIAEGSRETVVFSMKLVDLATLVFQQCGENYLQAELEVFADENGVRNSRGPRPAESVLDVRPDMLLDPPIAGPTGGRRGETLDFNIRYANQGNVGDSAKICIKLPLGTNANLVEGLIGARLLPKTLIQGFPDSVCFDVGLVESDSVRRDFTLRLPMTEHIPADSMRVCFLARIISPCDTLAANDTLSNCYDIDPLDLVAISKSAAPDPAKVGDRVTFTVNYENVNTFVTAHNVRITDRLPAGVTFVSANPPPFEFSNGLLTWRFDSLTAGARGTLQYTVLIPLDFYLTRSDSACAGIHINNSIGIFAEGPNGLPSPESRSRMDNNFARANVRIEPLSDLLAVEMDVETIRINPAASQLLPGDILVFRARFRNNSDRLPANLATVIDDLPDPGLTTLLQPLPANYVHEAAANRLVRRNFTLLPLQEDSVTFQVVIRSDIATCTNLNFVNRISILDSLEFDCNLINNVADSLFQIRATGDLLGITLGAAPLEVIASAPVNFTLNYGNTGTIDALNVVVADTLPPEIDYVSATPTPSRIDGNILSWNLGTLPRGANGVIAINAQVRDNVYSCDSLLLISRAGISSSPQDCAPGNNTGVATVILRTAPAQQPQLVQQQLRFTEQNGDACAEAGELLTVDIDFLNQSQLTAMGFDAQDVAVSPGSLEGFSFSHTTLPAGQTGTATFQIRVGVSDAPGSLSLSGLFTANGFCPRPLNAVYCFKPQARVDMIGVDLTDLQSDRDDCAGEGEQLNIVFIYENTSPTRADSMDLNVTIEPLGYTVLSSNRTLTTAGALQSLQTRVTLEAGARDSLRLQIQYADFVPQQLVVRVSAALQVSAVSGFVAPPKEDVLAICRDCYARPNPFIPAVMEHGGGVRFAPNDGQRVEIFDLEGNQIRSLTTRDRWNGRDENGRECAAGVYIWVIEGSCRGTLILAK